MTRPIFEVGETVVCEAVFVDPKTGAKFDPTNVRITILTKTKIWVDKASMIRDAVGMYHYDFQTTEPDHYLVLIEGEVITPYRVTKQVGEFEVYEPKL